jgi:tetratricopeptide (TPR) repeat protein
MSARTRLSIIGVMAACLGLDVWAQQQAGTAQQQAGTVQQQADAYFRQARTGDAGAAEKVVILLESAAASSPDDASVWNLLGRAYLMRLSLQARAGADPAMMAETVQRATRALDRTLELSPKNASALVGHGMGLTILAGIQRDDVMMARGVDEMNRAVALDPRAVHVRLNRAFTMVNLPPQVRHVPSIIEDLQLGVQRAGTYNPRARQTLHLLLGDVYAEGGHLDEARREYEAAASATTPSEQTQARLTSLLQGSVPPAAIASLRSGLATNCTMCHAK